jgi:peptidylprolyl isomerase
MASAKITDTVKVHYTGKLTDGTIFDDSLNREPLEFTIGKNNLIAGFENAVIGAQLQVSQDDGQEIVVSIIQITETHVTLDANHPLAGKDLVFEIKLVEILPPAT